MVRTIVLVFLFAIGLTPAAAQDTVEQRLRELLRRTTADLRAAQDGQAALQASLESEKQSAATLRKQVEDLTARLDEAAKNAVSEAEITRLQAKLSEADARQAALTTGLTQLRDAYQKAVDFARARDAEAKTSTALAQENGRKLGVCQAANERLETLANDILHLYQTRDFRAVLLGSYEPLLGFKKVELQNTIQDYEDKILDQKYRPERESAKVDGRK
jgi:chromosome segregation ATPase